MSKNQSQVPSREILLQLSTEELVDLSIEQAIVILDLMKTNTSPKPENLPSEINVARPNVKTLLPSAPLPEHISQNIETIITLHTRNEKNVPRHRRVVEVVTAFFSRPLFLYSVLLVVGLWLLVNTFSHHLNIPQFDPTTVYLDGLFARLRLFADDNWSFDYPKSTRKAGRGTCTTEPAIAPAIRAKNRQAYCFNGGTA